MNNTTSPHPRLGEAVELLKQLIAVPSFSRDEAATASIWENWLAARGAAPKRIYNNVYCIADGFSRSKPTLLLNSHHDTVKPAASYSRDPFEPKVEDGRLYGLGSNDAGGAGVALACTFLDLMHRSDLPFNLIFAITAAEEVMGEHGMRAFLPHLAALNITPDMAIVGEPTGMQPAVAERGLLVLDGLTQGVCGHAARNEGVNALYLAIDDINALRQFAPAKVSELLGPISINITMIQSGTQHNVIPDKCSFVVDVRTTDAYTNTETVEMLRNAVRHSTLTPRSTYIGASALPSSHPLYQAALSLGLKPFVSPTTSDMAIMHGIPSLKIGPGQSSRSHSADEYILISEINDALTLYPRLILSIHP